MTPNIEDKKNEFLTLCRTLITRNGSEELLSWLEGSDFFTAPASTKYHGAHDGGLVEHSLNVYHCLCGLLKLYGLEDVYDAESVAIVSLMHDLCKVNFYKKGTRNVKVDGVWKQKEVFEIDEKFLSGHGEKSVIILQNFIKLSVDEIYAIRYHMGAWGSDAKGGDFSVGKAFERSKLAALTHMADMSATYLFENKEE